MRGVASPFNVLMGGNKYEKNSNAFINGIVNNFIKLM